jgi:hypothetical protein
MFRPIKCPHCRCEYLPGEIFQPDYFLGKPKNVIRNKLGEILGHEGTDMDTHETFVCIQCDKEFNVTARVMFDVDDGTVDTETFTQLSLFDL